MNKAIFPGTFDPFHNGHLEVLTKALVIFDEVIIYVANNTEKNSLRTKEERAELVRKVLSFHELDDRAKVVVQDGDEYTANYAKDNGITNIVRGIRQEEIDPDELYLMKRYKEYNPKLNFTHIYTPAKASSSFINKNREEKETIENMVSESIIDLI